MILQVSTMFHASLLLMGTALYALTIDDTSNNRFFFFADAYAPILSSSSSPSSSSSSLSLLTSPLFVSSSSSSRTKTTTTIIQKDSNHHRQRHNNYGWNHLVQKIQRGTVEQASLPLSARTILPSHIGSFVKEKKKLKEKKKKKRVSASSFSFSSSLVRRRLAVLAVSLVATVVVSTCTTVPPAGAISNLNSPLNHVRTVLPRFVTAVGTFCNTRRQTVCWRTGKKWLYLMVTAAFFTRLRRQQQRQQLDGTSEWGRYAKHPMTRGRALSSLMLLQVLPLWFGTIIVQQYEKIVGAGTSAGTGDSISTKNETENKEGEEITTAATTTTTVLASSKLAKHTGEVLANGLLRIGPLYIKLGQIISCRDDLICNEWITSLASLQDSVPAKSGQAAYDLIYAAMDGQENFHHVFESFDPNPIAAASLGQVHKAVLQPQYRLSAVSSSSSSSTIPSKNNNNFPLFVMGFFKTFQAILKEKSPLMNKIDKNSNSIDNSTNVSDVADDKKVEDNDNGNDNDGMMVVADDDNDGVVAVKVQRSYLREIYDQDFAFLSKIARIMDAVGGSKQRVGGISQSWTSIFDDAKDIMFREIDYRDEAENGIKFINDFGLSVGGKPTTTPQMMSLDGESILPSSAEWIRAPYVYQDVCTEKLLVMEYVPSIKITNEEKLREANVTIKEREYLADMLARSYLRQFTCNLFFSTDPHPGNLGVEIVYPSSSITNTKRKHPRVRLVFYDFGQAATLNRNQGDGIIEIMEAIIDTDVDKSITAFQKMGVLKEDADLTKVRKKIASNYKEGKIKANQKKLKSTGYYEAKQKMIDANTEAAVDNTNTTTATTITTVVVATDDDDDGDKNTNATMKDDMEVMGYFTLPAEYAFVGRALTQMDGVGKTLDPDFDFISSSAPYIVEIKGTGKYLQDEASKFWKKIVADDE